MRISKKLVCLLVLCSLSFLLFGCWLNDDDDDQVWPVTGAIKLSAVADAEPILKTIATATVAAGQTNSDSITNTPINYETTAKAIAYEAWTARGSKSIDEFAPNQAALKNIVAACCPVRIDFRCDPARTSSQNRSHLLEERPATSQSPGYLQLVSRVYRGRKKALAPAQAEILRQRARDGEEKAHLAREFGIRRETVHQHIRSES